MALPANPSPDPPQPAGDPDATLINPSAPPARAPFPADAAPLPGVIAKVRLERLLGRGGMGEVWLGEHQTLKVPVAVKLMLPELARRDPSIASRFVREAQIAARIDHPNLVRVLDAGTEGPWRYIVMQYVPGGSVEQLLAQGPLKVSQALRIVAQVASALTVAAQHGVVHRDIKPANLLVGRDGTVKLADLGLAKMPQGGLGTTFTTQAAHTLGSPLYMAPEQIANPAAADIRADIYALGATLYHLLTGRPPFPGDSLYAVLKGHAETPVPDVRALRPQVPAVVQQLVAKMLAKRPEDRYQTPQEITAAIQDIARQAAAGGLVESSVAPTPLAVTPSTPASTTDAPKARQPSSRRVRLIAVALALLVLLPLLAWVFWPSRRTNNGASSTSPAPAAPASDATTNTRPTVAAPVGPEPFTRQQNLDVTGYDRGMMVLTAARQMLLWGPRGLNLLDLRDFRQQQRCDVGALVVQAAADAAGARVLLLLTQPDAHDGVEASRRVQLWDPQTQELGAVLKDAPPSSYASVSADGQYALLSAVDGSVQHWHLADPPSLWQTLKDARSGSAAGIYVEARRAGPAGQQNPSRSETPNRVLTGGSDGRLRLWDLAAGSLLKEGAVLDWTPVTGLMLLTATHQAVVAGANGEVALVDLESFQVLQRTRLGSQVVRVFAGLPNGKAVVLGGGGGELVVWSLDSGQMLLQPQAQLGRVTGAALTLMAPHLHSLGGSALRSWVLTEDAQTRMPEFDLATILQRRQRGEGRER